MAVFEWRGKGGGKDCVPGTYGHTVSYPPPSPLSVAYRVAGLYQELSFDAMCSSFFFPKSPLLNYTARKGGGRHSPRYGFIAVRGNVGIIRVHVVHQLLRDNGKLEKWTFSLKFLHVVGFCV